MHERTTISISDAVAVQLERVSAARGESVEETLAAALRVLQQETIGDELARRLSPEEIAWLEAPGR